MKQAFTIILFWVIGCASYAQSDSIRGKQFQLTGKLIKKMQQTPGCGLVAWATVVEFEVIKLTGMNYQNKELGIIFTCPENYSNSFFKKGNTYTVVFSDKNQTGFEWTIPNKDLLKKNGLSFEPYAISVKRM